MGVASLFLDIIKLYPLLLLSSELVNCVKLSTNVANTKLQKNITSRVPMQILDPQPYAAPTFAEIGAFFTPRAFLDTSGNNAFSFLHSSNASVGVDHDIVKLSEKSIKFHISGTVDGLVKDKPLTLIVGTTYGSRFDMLVEKIVSTSDNKFSFSLPKGKFYIKTEGSGYFLPGVKRVFLPCKVKKCQFVNETFEDVITVQRAPDDGSIYTYNWKLQNTSQFGVESINKIPQDEASLLSPASTVISHVDASDAAAKLKLLFGVELHGVWGAEYSNRLLSVFLKFDFLKRENSTDLKNQKWLLTDESLYPQDVEITRNVANADSNGNHNVVEDSEYEQIVKISREAFKYSVKQAIDKKKNGFYFSRRLYKSVIRAICLHNPRNMKRVFKEVHNVEIIEPFELEHMIRDKKAFTHYPSSHYQSWLKHPEELVEILTSWREYPSGLHKVKGLRYFLRRQDGMVNPEEPTAPAIAYPRGPNTDSYIEFMESGFHNYPDVSRLILHEIGHFVDFNTVSDELRGQWSEIGGWYKDPKDPDGWSTSKQTEFVSAYAHQKNPGEDFASSLADYVLNPRLLRTRAPEKFKFIKDNIMGGAYYLIKASHEFKVLNLGNADYFYPGRLSEINVVVTGKVKEMKKVKFTFKLLQIPTGSKEDSAPSTCAKYIKFRLFSEIGTFEDIFIRAKSGCSHVLEQEITMNHLKKRGVWTADQITITDDKGLQRFVGSGDFGLRVWINNGSEDFQDPRVLTNSVSLSMVRKGEAQAIRVGWLLVDDSELRAKNAGYAAINGNSSNQHSLSAYSQSDNEESKPNNLWRKDVWSGARKVPLQFCSTNSPDLTTSLRDPSLKFNTHKLEGLDNFEGLSSTQVTAGTFNCYRVALNIPITSSSRSGDYFLTQIISYDSAGNSQLLQWPEKAGPFISYKSSNPNPDNTPPRIKDISVKSSPANPEAPNGETLVEISFNLCDSGSGISALSLTLRDPFGANLLLYPSRSSAPGCQQIVHTNVLPKGSIPGVWHLNKIYAQDFAGNEVSADLTERILVDPPK